MKIGGYLKTSWIDYPHRLASVIYVAGCNFRCPYCHNRDLVLKNNTLDEARVYANIKKRRHLIEGIVLSGGEPTLYDLKALKTINELGYFIKLDTNGYDIEKIKTYRYDLNYIAMDIKNGPKRYSETCGRAIDLDKIYGAIQWIKTSGIDYEFRSTLTKTFHSLEDIEGIFSMVSNSKRLVLQQYEYSSKQIENKDFSYYSLEEMSSFKARFQVQYNIEEVLVRGKY